MKKLWMLPVALWMFACDVDDEGEAELKFNLYGPSEPSTAAVLLDPQWSPAEELEFALYSFDYGSADVKTFNLSERSAELSVSFDRDYQLFVRGFSGDTLHFNGASVPFKMKKGEDLTLNVMIGRSNCVELNKGKKEAWDMKVARAGASATLLEDGRVLIAGGAQLAGTVDDEPVVYSVENSMEIFDPRTNSFSSVNIQMDKPRAWHTATMLPKGKILFLGGFTQRDTLTESAALLDTHSWTWENISSPFEVGGGRAGHQAVVLSDGSVLIAGGRSSKGVESTVYRYMPSSRQFIQQGDFFDGRENFTLLPINQPEILAIAIGGLGVNGQPMKSFELFTVGAGYSSDYCHTSEPRSPSKTAGCFFQPQSELKTARFGHAAVLTDNGNRVLVMGGYASADKTVGAEKLELINEKFEVYEMGNVEGLGGDLTADLLFDGSVLVLGGRLGSHDFNTAMRLSPHENDQGQLDRYKSYPLEDNCILSQHRFGHQTVKLPQHTVLIVGGAQAQQDSAGKYYWSSHKRGEQYFPFNNDVYKLAED